MRKESLLLHVIGCLLPIRLNASVYQITGEYLPGENVSMFKLANPVVH